MWKRRAKLTQRAETLIRAFRQGGKGNCVSIAIIKAGMEQFGTTGLFMVKASTGGSLELMMRDGKDVLITDEELALATKESGFLLQDESEEGKLIFSFANLAFAAMAKRAELDGNDKIPATEMTYPLAIKSLNDGELWNEGPRWLGLRHHVRTIGRSYRYDYPACVGASPRHCFFLSYGYEDQYGTPDSTASFFDSMKIRHVYRISSEPSY